MERLVVGCMTGTSIDSIDASLVRIRGRGLKMRAEFVRGASSPLGDLAPRLRRLADQQPVTAGDIVRLSRDFSLAHVPVIREAAGANRLDLVCIHGQTVFHQPPTSWQLLTPANITQELKAPIVFDLRAADLAAGGQGAPITPIADWVLFRDASRPRTVVNLGGFCNLTKLPANGGPDQVAGFDLCPCNHILDSIARECLGREYDEDGRAALTGTPSTAAISALRALVPLGPGRSLGTGDELGRWVAAWKPKLAGPDLAASACALIADRICGQAASDDIVLAGGSVRNAGLVAAIRTRARGGVLPCDELGTPAAYREAACFAVLGALCQDRIPITLPQVTKVPPPAPVSGAWVLP